MSHIKWHSIESFHNVRKFIEACPDHHLVRGVMMAPLQYNSKIKLHGTNAGITIKNDGKDVFAQSRTSIITPGNDNVGFAAWVDSIDDQVWTALFSDCLIHTVDNFDTRFETMTIFGEWCGQRIQKGAAICQVPHNIFAVFAIQFDDWFVIDPHNIHRFLLELTRYDWLKNVPNGDICKVHILPWYRKATFDFSDTEQMQNELDRINKIIEEIDACDPWVKEVFNIEGPGEGLVWYPGSKRSVLTHDDFEFVFKTKGEKHKVVKSKNAATLDPEVAANVEAFADMFVTTNRLEQIRNDHNFKFEKKYIGPFLKEFCSDVKKESEDELDASGLTWKEVSAIVQNRARNWFLEQTEKL